MAPNQPTHNMQDDLSPGRSKDASNTGLDKGAGFDMLQRSYKSGGVLPMDAPDSGTVPGKLAGSGQS